MDDKELYNEWIGKCYDPALVRFPERKKVFKTSSNIEMPPVIPADQIILDREDSLGYTGQYPFKRGVKHTMYRGRLWTMRQ